MKIRMGEGDGECCFARPDPEMWTPRCANGRHTIPEKPKRMAAMSKGVSGLRPPSRETMLNPDQTTTTAVAAAKPLNRWRRWAGTGGASAVMRRDSGISGAAHLTTENSIPRIVNQGDTGASSYNERLQNECGAERGRARMDSTRLTGPGLGHDGRILFFVTGAGLHLRPSGQSGGVTDHVPASSHRRCDRLVRCRPVHDTPRVEVHFPALDLFDHDGRPVQCSDWLVERLGHESIA